MSTRLRRALRIGLSLAFPLGAQAAEPAVSTQVFHGFPHEALYSVSFEGERGIAVGDFGLIVASNDGGASWERRAAFTDAALFGVTRRDGKCIAVGQQGAVFVSSDCAAWKPAAAGTKARLLSVDMNQSGVAYAVGGFGTLLKSTDWGHSWEAVTPDWKALTNGVEPHLYAVQVDADGTATVAGEFEMILRSTGSGGWKVLHSGKKSLFALRLLKNGDGYAVGQEGVILKTADSGDSWQTLKSPTAAILNDVFAGADGHVAVAGVYSVMVSDDYGKSWRRDASQDVGRSWYQALGGAVGARGMPQVVAVGAGAEIRMVRN